MTPKQKAVFDVIKYYWTAPIHMAVFISTFLGFMKMVESDDPLVLMIILSSIMAIVFVMMSVLIKISIVKGYEAVRCQYREYLTEYEKNDDERKNT